MKNIQPTTQFRKDLKRYKNNPEKLEALKDVLELIRNEQPIPSEYRPHHLLGQYKGCMECHIKGDFLLIWFDRERDIVELVRLGSHSELFGKKR
jgi:mRNA interferase YafQ